MSLAVPCCTLVIFADDWFSFFKKKGFILLIYDGIVHCMNVLCIQYFRRLSAIGFVAYICQSSMFVQQQREVILEQQHITKKMISNGVINAKYTRSTLVEYIKIYI